MQTLTNAAGTTYNNIYNLSADRGGRPALTSTLGRI